MFDENALLIDLDRDGAINSAGYPDVFKLLCLDDLREVYIDCLYLEAVCAFVQVEDKILA